MVQGGGTLVESGFPLADMHTTTKHTLLGKIHRLEVFIDSRMQQGCGVYQFIKKDAAAQ